MAHQCTQTYKRNRKNQRAGMIGEGTHTLGHGLGRGLASRCVRARCRPSAKTMERSTGANTR